MHITKRLSVYRGMNLYAIASKDVLDQADTHFSSAALLLSPAAAAGLGRA
jgi:hypothetical protein